MSANMEEGRAAFQGWLDSLRNSDPELHAELTRRLTERVTAREVVRAPVSGPSIESMSSEAGVDIGAIALETIVREGRPALLVRDNRIALDSVTSDIAADVVVERLREATGVVEPAIPLVGRIDVANYPGSLTYVGTGWLVDRDVVVTNRHVAEIIARAGDGKYHFRPGRFGEPMSVTLDYRHELGIIKSTSARVSRVIWIEPDARKADIAFLEVARRTDGTRPEFITLADQDARADSDVAVIGYPARAPAHIIPDQEWMDQIYGGNYDVKRIAPGLMRANNRGWATHDCTTLGGNSGSVVVDMKTGKAVALHFAGLYMIENYAVPASTIRKYLKDRPWQGGGEGASQVDHTPATQPPGQQVVTSGVEIRTDRGQVSVTIPLTITISLGGPQTTTTAGDSATSGGASAGEPGRNIEEAARELFRSRRVEGVYSVWPGYEIKQGRLSDAECVVVSAHPDRLEAVRAAMPQVYRMFPVDVRPASISEQVGGRELEEAPTTTIKYNDEDRTGAGFSFNWVDEEMSLVLHVGPERSWTVLSEFLKGSEDELVSSIYEFHAAHIAKAIEKELDEGAAMTLVLDVKSRDPNTGNIPTGDFDRSETFEGWEEGFGDRFERVFVPKGSQGLMATSYHIKVTVRDGSAFWLSSGNWKRSSQPLIPAASLDNPSVTSSKGNREWHVVVKNDTLAKRFRNHIKADYDLSRALGGQTEAVDDEIMIDVPAEILEAVDFEAAPARVLQPLKINRRVRVKPLLTPDKKGAVYSNAVLRLIRSATRQLLFQNQYIGMKGADSGFLKQLVDAMAAKAQELDDFRIILRSGNDEEAYDLSQLKRRGVDVMRQVRILTNTHTKGIIVDGKRVLIGSHNWSSQGVSLNRDASLIFDDEQVAQYYAEAFELDWERSREPRFDEGVFESIRPAAGNSPPPGFVRMSLSEYLEG